MSYDLIIIGAGPGGYVAAIKAAQLGKKVALIERREVGGTCLNRGCIPTKTLAHAAGVLREIQSAARLGIKVESVSYDIAAIYARKDEVVGQLRDGVEALLKANGVTLLRGDATLEAAGKVRINGETLEAGSILLAVGSIPSRPQIAGLDLPDVVTSDALLATDAPFYRRLTIIGGGVIGVEFASIYAALCCEVTIIEAMERVLPSMDKEISQNLSMLLKKRGVKIFTGATVEEITRGDCLTCRFTAKGQSGQTDADGVLVAIGRRANTAGLLADGISLDLTRGMIPVNERFETCIAGVYAIGDAVLGGIQLAHIASAQGINAVCGMFGETPPIDLSVVPSCIYTDPEIAAVGMTESDAKAAGIPVKTGKFIMSANGKSIIEQAERGFIKIVSHAETGALLGAQLMCSRATDLLGELSAAIANGLTIDRLSAVIRPHPTFAEGITEALEDTHGAAIHIAPRRKMREDAGK